MYPEALLARINNLAVSDFVKFQHLLYYILDPWRDVFFQNPNSTHYYSPALRHLVVYKLIGITGGNFHNFINSVSRAKGNITTLGFGVLHEALLDVHVDLGANPDYRQAEIDRLEANLDCVYFLSGGVVAPVNPGE